VTGTFPEGFRWGVASSGHQTEGGNTRSDTWFLEHVRPTVFREPSGQACNSYQLWREDVDLVAGLGLDAYRFSVEWARVEPVEGQFSAEALAHYRAIVDRCLAAGIAPVVTYNHFTSPHWFARRGGWLDPRAPATFARYCDVVTERLGEGIAWALTLNEPNLPRLLSWLDIPDAVRGLERATLLAASEQAGVPRYRVGNVVLPEEMDAMADAMAAGHRAAKDAIKARRPDLPVGLSIAIIVVGAILVTTHWGWVHVAELTANSIEGHGSAEVDGRRRQWLATIQPYTHYEINTSVEDDGSITIYRKAYRPTATGERRFTFTTGIDLQEVHSGDEPAAAVTERAELLRREAAQDTERERERYQIAADAYESVLLDNADEQQRLLAQRAASEALSEQINSNLRDPPLVE